MLESKWADASLRGSFGHGCRTHSHSGDGDGLFEPPHRQRWRMSVPELFLGSGVEVLRW